ncbi:MAG: hypothetical protein IT285_01615 [Bdellovibrionales bacterium]|nr:hypothetical protein [Bdellovibrionales bacterium]
MRSRRSLAAALAAIALLTGCGQFGDKLDRSKILKYTDAATGCLNNLGPEVEKYLKGDIDPADWEDTWDCALGAVDTFRDFVEGSVPGGYTVSDIHDFLKTFMVTDRPIPRSLVEATFKLKASIFGGPATKVTHAELEIFKDLMGDGKLVSMSLIPHLKARLERPDTQVLLAFASAVARGSRVIGAKLRALTPHTSPMLASDLKTLMSALGDTFDWELDPEIIPPLLATKALLIAGSADRIDPGQWADFFEVGGHFGGAAAAGMSMDDDFMDGPNEMGEFIYGLALEIRKSLDQALQRHGGRVALSHFDTLVDSIPEEWLENLNKVDKQVLKDTLRPLLRRILWSRNPLSVGPETFDLLYKKLDLWRTGQTHLETIFERYKLDPMGVTTQEFVNSASSYLTTVEPDQLTHVRRIIGLAQDFRPIFVGDDTQISFVPWIRNSQGNLSKLHWLNLAVQHLLESYSSDSTRNFIYKQDMTQFISDVGWLLLEFAILDPAEKNIDQRRFFEADNFVFGSNGDFKVDLHELTNYGAFLFSIGNLSKRILTDLEPVCAIPGGGLDRYKHPYMDAECVRKEYFGRYYRYWEKFPQMVTFFESLSDQGREEVILKIEMAARAKGYSNNPWGKIDIDNVAGVIHYIDAVFFRFDLDGSQRMDIDEVLAGYPKFKKMFAEYTKIDENQDFILKSVFTYLIRYGHPPRETVGGYAHFVAWMAGRPFWKTDADRMSIFNVFSSLASQGSVDP